MSRISIGRKSVLKVRRAAQKVRHAEFGRSRSGRSSTKVFSELVVSYIPNKR